MTEFVKSSYFFNDAICKKIHGVMCYVTLKLMLCAMKWSASIATDAVL